MRAVFKSIQKWMWNLCNTRKKKLWGSQQRFSWFSAPHPYKLPKCVFTPELTLGLAKKSIKSKYSSVHANSWSMHDCTCTVLYLVVYAVMLSRVPTYKPHLHSAWPPAHIGAVQHNQGFRWNRSDQELSPQMFSPGNKHNKHTHTDKINVCIHKKKSEVQQCSH